MSPTYADYYFENSEENKKRLALALQRARQEGGKSQEYMGFELQVARKTIQNWEKGVSSPSFDQCIAWFKALNVAPLPYLFQYVFPDMDGIKSKDNDEKLRQSLITLVRSLPPEGVRQLLFLFYGEHGSSPRGVLNMINAHLQTPLPNRVTQAGVILHNYEIASQRGELVCPNNIKPNVDLLKQALSEGEKAVIERKDNYIL